MHVEKINCNIDFCRKVSIKNGIEIEVRAGLTWRRWCAAVSRPGVRPAALADVRRILDGDADHIDPRRLSYIGHLVDAAE